MPCGTGVFPPPPARSATPCLGSPPTPTPPRGCPQNTDCAAALVLTTRAEAERRGLLIMASLRSFAVVRPPVAWVCCLAGQR